MPSGETLRISCDRCGQQINVTISAANIPPETQCNECGSAEIHPDSMASKCRRCDERGGNTWPFVTEIDHDKLRALFPPAAVALILEKCRKE
jgi:hypothetical protein